MITWFATHATLPTDAAVDDRRSQADGSNKYRLHSNTTDLVYNSAARAESFRWSRYVPINSLAPGRRGSNFKSIIYKLIMQNCSLGSLCEIAPGLMPWNSFSIAGLFWVIHRWIPFFLSRRQALQALILHSLLAWTSSRTNTVYPKKYAHGFCFTVLCFGYTLTDFPISIRLTSLALWQSNDCPSASKATLMNMDKYFMWIHYERLHNHNKAKHNKTVCIFLGIYCR